MLCDWESLPAIMQLASEAMHRAATVIAAQAELFADEMEGGELSDRGGPDALRLFAAVVRAGRQDPFEPAGHA